MNGNSVFSWVSLACVLVMSSASFGQDTHQRSRAVFLKHLVLGVHEGATFESFDIGEVDLGERVPVQIEFRNLSEEFLEIKPSSKSINKNSLKNPLTRIKPQDPGILELAIDVPDDPMEVTESLSVVVLLCDRCEFYMSFRFRIRGLIKFSKEVHSLVLPKRTKECSLEIPIIASDEIIWEDAQFEADPSLSSIELKKRKEGDRLLVLATYREHGEKEASLVGNLRLRYKGQVCSETRIRFKKQSDFELYPDFLALKFDPKSKKYNGEVILKSMKKEVPIAHARVSAELSSEDKLSWKVGEMSTSTSRVYVNVDDVETLRNQNGMILFSIESPLTEEEHVLWVRVLP
jgi:hypothetical protein